MWPVVVGVLYNKSYLGGPTWKWCCTNYHLPFQIFSVDAFTHCDSSSHVFIYLFLFFWVDLFFPFNFVAAVNRPTHYVFTVWQSQPLMEFEMFLSILGLKLMAYELKFFGLAFVRSRYFCFQWNSIYFGCIDIFIAHVWPFGLMQ